MKRLIFAMIAASLTLPALALAQEKPKEEPKQEQKKKKKSTKKKEQKEESKPPAH